MSFKDDLNEWMKDPEFEAQYWKTRFQIANKERFKYYQWLLDVYKDHSQFKKNPELRELVFSVDRFDYERGQAIITEEYFKELYPDKQWPWRACSDCDGTGTRSSWPHGTCPTCSGSGKYL